MTNPNTDDREKRLSQLLSQKLSIEHAVPSYPPKMDLDFVPLTSDQKRIWILHHIISDAPLNNRPTLLRFHGKLDQRALEQAITTWIGRHAILRSQFIEINGELGMRLRPSWNFSLKVEDLTGLPLETQLKRMRKRALNPFDLETDLLVRFFLFESGENEYFLLFVTHHIVFDSWSEKIFINELSLLYNQFIGKDKTGLAASPLEFKDIAAWQASIEKQEKFTADLGFWKTYLAEIPQLDLRGDNLRPQQQDYRGKIHQFLIPKALIESLMKLCREENSTLFMGLFSGFEILLKRYSGLEKFIIGTPISNREYPGSEELIGVFINSLAVRSDLSHNPSSRELVGRVRDTMLTILDHKECPFEKVVEALVPNRPMDRPPIFQVMFNLENVPEKPVEFVGLDMRILPLDMELALFDLQLEIQPQQNGNYLCLLNYNTNLFSKAAIETISGYYLKILSEMTDAPDMGIDGLPILTEDEKQLILSRSIGLRLPIPQARIEQLFEQQVCIRPDAVALVEGEKKLSYLELNNLANKLANKIRAQGVQPGDVVAVAVPRSMSAVIAILAVLKSGGVYLPLDPTLPEKRLRFILDDSNTSMVLMEQGREGPFNRMNVKSLLVSDTLMDKKHVFTANPSIDGLIGDLAYILYTSGSTGEPKGVCVPHRGVVRLVKNTDHMRIVPEDAVLLLQPLVFDASMFELWGAILNGAKLVVLPSQSYALHDLIETIETKKITVMALVADFFCIMVEEALDALRGLRYLLVGGAVVSAEHTRKALKGLPGVTLINVYGPTENSILTACYMMDHPDQVFDPLPIGKPISNTNIYILDEAGRLVPDGVVGELYAGGLGVAAGYLNRPEMTDRFFVEDPFISDQDAKMYKTGDLARWRQDGLLEFIGRVDQQVKLRGLRIELGEIEAILNRHPDVQRAAVVVQNEETLKAFVAADQFSEEQVKFFLAAHLPAYMIPESIVRLEALPELASGKVDRQALAENRYLPPRVSEDELKMIEAWNSTARDYPVHKRLEEFFEFHAVNHPDAIALRFDNQEWTYAQLNVRANQFAIQLQQVGLKPGQLAAVSLKRSVDFVIVVLAVLKNGAAYLPIDMNYPEERFQFMLRDSGAALLIKNAAEPLEYDLPEIPVIEFSSSLANGVNFENLNVPGKADDSAYVIYTSGTSGVPKGVRVTHRNVARTVVNSNYDSFSADDVFLLHSSLSFDASVFELWAALLNGACLGILPDTGYSLQKLSESICDYHVTKLFLTPKIFNLLVDEYPETFNGVDRIFSGGEVMSPKHAKQLFSNQAQLSLVNLYGPTENTVISSFYCMNRVDQVLDPVPIGRPLSNSTVYVLDDHYKMVPIGQTGEIYLGGDGVAAGYINRPNLNQERFLPDPFSTKPGAKMYRSGDLGRWREDGNLEFVGRIDRQQKINGFRIEPEEIEQVLLKHSAVKQTAVVLSENSTGQKQLVAFYTGIRQNPQQLRQTLQAYLPEYMLPQRYEYLDHMPTLSNGKMDYRQLSIFLNEKIVGKDRQTRPKKPGTPIEETVADVWKDILKLDDIDFESSFFALGGHSLLAVHCISRLRKIFDIDLSVQHLFEALTVRALALKITVLLAGKIESGDVLAMLDRLKKQA
jgi:amino acid adenylation domain-containing protein